MFCLHVFRQCLFMLIKILSSHIQECTNCFRITHIDTATRRLEVRVFCVPSRDTRVVIVHWVALLNTFDHVGTDCRIMGVANDLATKQPSQWICKSIAACIKVKLRGEFIKSLPCKVYWAKTLPYHSEAWIGACFDPLSPAQVNHLKKCSSNIFILVPLRRNYFDRFSQCNR